MSTRTCVVGGEPARTSLPLLSIQCNAKVTITAMKHPRIIMAKSARTIERVYTKYAQICTDQPGQGLGFGSRHTDFLYAN